MPEQVQFTLTGFTQQGVFRVFAFQSPGARSERAEFFVRADLSLIRKYAIALQDLPLLCRRLLQVPAAEAEPHMLTFTEEEMAAHARNAARIRIEAAARRRPPRKPTKETSGGTATNGSGGAGPTGSADYDTNRSAHSAQSEPRPVPELE
ncbi:MAG: hypothetical protein ABL967_14215 [Bryobacteraceae bacterium]